MSYINISQNLSSLMIAVKVNNMSDRNTSQNMDGKNCSMNEGKTQNSSDNKGVLKFSDSKIIISRIWWLIGLIAVLILAEIAIIFLYCWYRIFDDTKICDFIVMCIIIIALILSVTVITVIFIAKILKPLVKMQFLKNLAESGSNTELIKKICDTLAEL